jgi:hypothetical protein
MLIKLTSSQVKEIHFKKKFKSNLLAKTTFSYLYGGLLKKYLKKQMIDIYRSKSK